MSTMNEIFGSRSGLARTPARSNPCCCCGGEAGISEVIVGQTIFVDPVNGSDVTGTRERLDLPFESIGEAIANALSGDEIILLPGNYTLAATVAMAALAQITITGWGGAAVTTVTPPPGGLPAFQMSGANIGQNRWRLAGFSILGGSGFAIDFGDATTDRFADINGLLELEDMVVDAIRLRRLGRVRITNLVVALPSQIIGCSDVTLQVSRLDELSLWYRNAGNNYETALGRIAYRLVGCEIADLLDLQGAPAVYLDKTTTVVGVQAAVETVGGTQDPVLSLHGRFGVAPGNGFVNAQAAGPVANFAFGNTAFALQPTVQAGLDLSDAVFFGDVSIDLQFPLVGLQNPNLLMFGGRDATFHGVVTISTANLSDPYYADFRNSTFTLNDVTVILVEAVEMDLRSAAFPEYSLAVSGGNGGYFRDRALTSGSPFDVASIGITGSDTFVVPFGSIYVLGTLGAFVSADDIAALPISVIASITDVSYVATSATGNAVLGADFQR